MQISPQIIRRHHDTLWHITRGPKTLLLGRGTVKSRGLRAEGDRETPQGMFQAEVRPHEGTDDESMCAMRWMDITLSTPTENLALDEALLEQVNGGESPDTLRFWESDVPFVVLGTNQVLTTETQEAHCKADGVAITRRCSAGGAVLQGPGSLNYTLVLTYDRLPEVRGLHDSYRYIIGRLAATLATMGLEARHAGISDLAVAGRKVSGTAQRRKRHAMLHHGTLLYRTDTEAMSRYLREPEDRPDYRGARKHGEFVTTLPLTPAALKTMVRTAFGVTGPAGAPSAAELTLTERLNAEKYTQASWTRRR